MAHRYQTNEIVIIDTHDALYGHVRMPAIIRYAHTDHPGYYEVNGLVPCGEYAAGPRDMAWWTVSEHEIVQTLGMAAIEHGPQPRASGRWVFIADSAPHTIEQPPSHRVVMD